MGVIYEWKQNSRVKCDAQVAGQIMQELNESVGLTPKNLLDVSREEAAPLHNEFEWRDDVAAEKYRESQASYIIRSIVVTMVDDEPAIQEPTRAFVITSNTETGLYEPIQAVIKDAEKMDFLLTQAKRDAEAFVKKYNTLKKVKPIVDAISETFGKESA